MRTNIQAFQELQGSVFPTDGRFRLWTRGGVISVSDIE